MPGRPAPISGTAGSLAEDLAHALDMRVFASLESEPALIASVRAKVLQAIAQDARPGHATVRTGESGWQSLGNGVERKVLHRTADAMSCLLRLAPGAVVAGHTHSFDEECLVLEGTLRIGSELVLEAGDFHLGRKGLAHEQASTETGSVVFLRGALPEPEPAL